MMGMPLHFQDVRFLADYAAMQHEPASPTSDSIQQEKASGIAASDRKAEGGNAAKPRVVEVGGREGPEPTRFGDWEKAGRCIDF